MERLTTSVLAAAITFALTNNVAAQLSLSDAASAAMTTMTKSPVATNMMPRGRTIFVTHKPTPVPPRTAASR